MNNEVLGKKFQCDDFKRGYTHLDFKLYYKGQTITSSLPPVVTQLEACEANTSGLNNYFTDKNSQLNKK